MGIVRAPWCAPLVSPADVRVLYPVHAPWWVPREAGRTRCRDPRAPLLGPGTRHGGGGAGGIKTLHVCSHGNAYEQGLLRAHARPEHSL